MRTRRRIPVYAVNISPDERPPLGLGMIIANLKKYLNEQGIDQLSFEPGYIIKSDDLKVKVKKHGSGIFLFSDFNWNYSLHLRLSQTIKENCKDTLILHGGPNIPADSDEAARLLRHNRHIDALCHGEWDESFGSFIKRYLSIGNFQDIPGVTCWQGDKILHQGSFQISRDINILPSPFLTGEFEEFIKMYSPEVISLETNRGCPYKCAFCCWGQALNQKIRLFSLDRVFQELEWAAKHKTAVIELNDANFGILARDVDIARYITELKAKYGYPVELVAPFAKNFPERISEIIGITRSAGLVSQAILAVQTLDPTTLEIINRKNLNLRHYDKAIKRFRNLNLPVTIEFMLGLPGSTLQSFKKDIQWACDSNSGIYAHSAIALTNSNMAARGYRQKYKIKTVEETEFSDPDFLKKWRLKSMESNQIVSTYSFTSREYIEMLGLTSILTIFYCESIARYIMSYLYNEYGISQVEFLSTIQKKSLKGYPLLFRLKNMEHSPASTIHFEGEKGVLWDIFTRNKWPVLYEELTRYIQDVYHLETDDSLKLVTDVQCFVMGYYGRPIPERRTFKHDFNAYFHDRLKGDKKKELAAYESFALEVTDPLNVCQKKVEPDYYEPHHGHIELSSPLNSLRFGQDLNELR